jgi:hypothetical protein
MCVATVCHPLFHCVAPVPVAIPMVILKLPEGEQESFIESSDEHGDEKYSNLPG